MKWQNTSSLFTKFDDLSSTTWLSDLYITNKMCFLLIPQYTNKTVMTIGGLILKSTKFFPLFEPADILTLTKFFPLISADLVSLAEREDNLLSLLNKDADFHTEDRLCSVLCLIEYFLLKCISGSTLRSLL